MSDYERYGEYNEIDGDGRGKPSGALLIIKIVIALACILVVGVLGFRIFLFNYYPKEMKNLYFTDTLTSHYKATNGNMSVLSQDYPYMYDNAEEGNFFASNVLVIRGAEMIQLAVRYNNATLDKLSEKYGTEISSSDLVFTLERNPKDENGTPEVIGTLEYNGIDTLVMYRYHKLVFSDVCFGDADSAVSWLRLRITVKNCDTGNDEYLIPVYHNHSEYNRFEEYKPSDDEVPSND